MMPSLLFIGSVEAYTGHICRMKQINGRIRQSGKFQIDVATVPFTVATQGGNPVRHEPQADAMIQGQGSLHFENRNIELSLCLKSRTNFLQSK